MYECIACMSHVIPITMFVCESHTHAHYAFICVSVIHIRDARDAMHSYMWVSHSCTLCIHIHICIFTYVNETHIYTSFIHIYEWHSHIWMQCIACITYMNETHIYECDACMRHVIRMHSYMWASHSCTLCIHIELTQEAYNSHKSPIIELTQEPYYRTHTGAL